eukprot:gene32541-40154_t
MQSHEIILRDHIERAKLDEYMQSSDPQVMNANLGRLAQSTASPTHHNHEAHPHTNPREFERDFLQVMRATHITQQHQQRVSQVVKPAIVDGVQHVASHSQEHTPARVSSECVSPREEEGGDFDVM